MSKYHCSHKVEPPKPPTNADRIRAMSDKEMKDRYFNDWLQQPVEEDDHA